MRDYQRDFLDFAIGRGVLRFGEFTLKSGRISPYFFNAGAFASGAALARQPLARIRVPSNRRISNAWAPGCVNAGRPSASR